MILQDPLFGLELGAVGYNTILVATIAYAIIALFGLVTVAIFIAVLLKARPILKKYPFFTIVWQLTLSNALNLVAQVTCVVPCTFLDSRGEQLSKWYEIGATIVDFTDIAVVFFVLLIALNRFAVLVMKPLERVFTKKSSPYTTLVTWLMVIVITALNRSLGPTQEDEREWEFADFFVGKHAVTTVIIILGYAVPIVILVIYIVTYWCIRRRPTPVFVKDSNQTDIALLWQGFLVALSLMFFRTINTFAPRVKTTLWWQWIVNILNEMASVGNHVLNPVLFLCSSKTGAYMVRVNGTRLTKNAVSDLNLSRL